ncbi:hypothetical protein Q7Z90_04725 [Glaesserella parasuis]|uniref:hypothetical protein n=1 Tax=Glaesserella parasuis TaxID=738 RepID=UPI00047EFADA|nr:hypothetical protein [Glaesserella parasuis]MDP0328130.1 hypothetical protein [Glaesserella parasuis]MDP0390812.1 hypothetical protein [Glaesserella parasuis]
MKITSSDYKYQHLGTVYRLVEQFELISRTDLAKLSGFAPASMTVLTKILIDHKLILERTSQNLPSRGRPAVGLSILTDNLAYMLMNLINIFSTEKIMLNSSLLRIKKPLFEQLQTKLQQNLLLNELRIDIVTSQYDWDSPLIPSIAIKLGIYEGCLLKGIVEI